MLMSRLMLFLIENPYAAIVITVASIIRYTVLLWRIDQGQP